MIDFWLDLVAGRSFALALQLHEDYDAVGAYAYELARGSRQLAAELIAKCAQILPTDRRKTIDGHRATGSGVIRRKKAPPEIEAIGLPEAIVLFQNHADHTITLETPSEFSLYDRVRFHKAFLASAFDRLGK